MSLLPFIGKSIVSTHVSDQLTVSGLIITLGGFAITVWQLRRTNESSVAASKAVNAFGLRLKTFEDSQMCASCLGVAREIERLHMIAFSEKALKSYIFLPERYNTLRHALVEFRERLSTELSRVQKKTIQNCIVKLSDGEKSIPQALNNGLLEFPGLSHIHSATQEVSSLLTLISVKLNKKAVG